jgi:hypothetical protein
MSSSSSLSSAASSFSSSPLMSSIKSSPSLSSFHLALNVFLSLPFKVFGCAFEKKTFVRAPFAAYSVSDSWSEEYKEDVVARRERMHESLSALLLSASQSDDPCSFVSLWISSLRSVMEREFGVESPSSKSSASSAALSQSSSRASAVKELRELKKEKNRVLHVSSTLLRKITRSEKENVRLERLRESYSNLRSQLR